MSENTFVPLSWDEKIVSGEEGTPRFAYAHATMRYSGVIEGESVSDSLLYYAGEGYDGGGTTSPGLERITGSVAGRKGSFVIRHEVGFDPRGIEGTWTVVPGSGTGELRGLTGSGGISGAAGAEAMSYTFEYSF
ncbi:DUF3224 domain-containing protein [Amycolatopsis anabasis]|uniref:DUF3224 domain-containing protein n=1 Tax=Amycolatopsis anabasis TaxID=1840409 RepID=UPI00131EA7A7|nr:DUF3224 domain-containing protein [Amycolatopsis anabasis]